VGGGTETHLFLIDLGKKRLTGARAQEMLESAGIVVNKNTIPFDTQSPMVTSGIRVGTPAVTTRGMGPEEMRIIAGLMDDILQAKGEKAAVDHARGEVEKLCGRFPYYE